MTQGLASREQTHSTCNSFCDFHWSWTPDMEGVNPKKKQMCNYASTMCVHTEAKLRSYRHLQLGVSERFSAWLCNLNVFKHTSVYKYWKGVVLKQMASHPPCEFPCTVLSQRDHWQIWTPNIWTLLAKRETPREDEILPLLWLLLLFSGSRGDPGIQGGRRRGRGRGLLVVTDSSLCSFSC